MSSYFYNYLNFNNFNNNNNFNFRSRSFSVPRYTPVVEVSSTTGLPKTGPPPEPVPIKTKRIKKIKSHKKKKSHRSKSSQIETVILNSLINQLQFI